MNIKDVLKDVRNISNYRLERRLNDLICHNPSYKHLNAKNRKLLLEMMEKYKKKLKNNIRISDYTIRKDMYYLYHHRIELDLSMNDLDCFRDILSMFKS